MRIVSWNVNSLKVRAELVGMYLDEEQPDVLCLQELKLPDDNVPTELFTERGYEVAVHGQKQWNGVLIASKVGLTDVVTGLPDGDEGQSRFIAATLGDGTRVVNLYCPQGQAADSPKFEYKLGFYDALIAWVAQSHTPDDPLIITGDLNVAPGPEDVHDLEAMQNVPTYHPLEHQRWGRLVDWGLQDAMKPHLEPGTFTFWDYRGMAFRFNKGYRIDHFLTTASVAARVETAWVDRPWRKKRGDLKASDHAPVGIALAG